MNNEDKQWYGKEHEDNPLHGAFEPKYLVFQVRELENEGIYK